MTDVGLKFFETLRGWFALDADDPRAGAEWGARADEQMTLHAMIEIDRLDAFIADPDRTAALTGTVTFPPLGYGLASRRGHFNVFSARVEPGTRFIVYHLEISHRGHDCCLTGRKVVRDRPEDDDDAAATLYARLHGGVAPNGPVLGAGVLRPADAGLADVARSIHIIGADGDDDAARRRDAFGRLILGPLWERYGRRPE